MNYTELSQAVQDWTENYDETFIDNIPVFVKAAEKKIYNAVKLPNVSVSDTGVTVNGTNTVTPPTDFLHAFEIAVVVSGEWQYLSGKEVGYIRTMYPVPTDTAVPKYYAMLDDTTLLLGPTPDAAYTIQYRYFAYPESIVTATNTWLGDNFDQLLLYGALVEAYVFMKGDEDVMKSYVGKYAEQLAVLQQYNNGEIPTDAFRGGQFTRK